MSATSSRMASDISRFRSIEIGGPRHETVCRGLVLASASVLFLHSLGYVPNSVAALGNAAAFPAETWAAMSASYRRPASEPR